MAEGLSEGHGSPTSAPSWPQTARSVLLGDVVAFTSPLASQGDASHVMVRRVAALEGDELVSTSESGEEEEVMQVPPGQCWVLADNEELKPPQVRVGHPHAATALTSTRSHIVVAAGCVLVLLLPFTAPAPDDLDWRPAGH